MLVCLTRAALVTAFNETERGRIWSTELLRNIPAIQRWQVGCDTVLLTLGDQKEVLLDDGVLVELWAISKKGFFLIQSPEGPQWHTH